MKHQTDSSANHLIVSSDADSIDLLAPYWKEVTEKLHPLLEISFELSPHLCQTGKILEAVRIEEHVSAPVEGIRGRKQIDRRPMARAFLVKAIMNLVSTRQLVQLLQQSRPLRQLCGMEKVPSEPTFSRAFAEFAQNNLGDKVHVAMVEKFVSNQIVMHCSHDTTAVEAREKAVKKTKKLEPSLKKRGRPKKGEIRPPKELTRLERQVTMEADAALAELPRFCDRGFKKDTDGNEYWWRGYKAHIVWADGMVPLCCVTTSASLHDNQGVIPIMKRVAQKVRSLYDLMDSAYDASAIREVSL